MLLNNLPDDVDFSNTETFDDIRLNRAMAYLVGRIAAVEQIVPSLTAAQNELIQNGLNQLATTLAPIFTSADAMKAHIVDVQTQIDGILSLLTTSVIDGGTF
jgi:hypothetical protein